MSLTEVDDTIDAAFPTLEGWCTPAKAKRIARLVVETGGGTRCVELGVFGGRVVIAMGLGIKHCLDGFGIVDGIDPYNASASLEGTNAKANDEWWTNVDYDAILKSAHERIRQLGLSKIVRLRIVRSHDIVAEYPDRCVDILHLDANHSAETSTQDVTDWAPKMRPGGYLVFDDTDWPTTRPAQLALESTYKFTRVEQYDKWAIFRAPPQT
jgi:hypothetical protein